MTEFRLTEKQRRLAEEKHYVLEQFLLDRKLPMEEFYDELVFGFLKAVCIYEHYDRTVSNTFESVACMCLTQALKECMKAKKNQWTEVFSLDAPLPGSRERIADVLEDPNMDVCGIICDKLCGTGKQYKISHKSFHTERPGAVAV